MAWDHYDVDLKKIKEPREWTLEEEEEAKIEKAMIRQQVHDIEKIIKTVGNASISKANSSRGVMGPVRDALEHLVEVSYLQNL